ncbi:hypothetical protein chiPu_0016392 [Chiloscyllium punctatum]|uniref:Uncharacterized protein n=1 Tax=Chiloscyllium punctatum TaxID=137246 RepID=A0A401T5L5_CHIPU|nr:hypothetical protein [Chiloscyllium punctatum]
MKGSVICGEDLGARKWCALVCCHSHQGAEGGRHWLSEHGAVLDVASKSQGRLHPPTQGQDKVQKTRNLPNLHPRFNPSQLVKLHLIGSAGGGWKREMNDLAEESMSDPTGHFKTLALRAVDLPVSLYRSLPEVKLPPVVRKLLLISVVGAASLAILTHQLKRKRGKKKQEEETEKEQSPWEQELFIPEFSRTAASEKG